MSDIRSIPEVAGLDSSGGVVRLSPELDVPLTERVRDLIDCPEFRRLSGIPQLGLVSLVYPAATHSRFEHSLGVYRLGLLFLRHLSHNERFAEAISREQAELFIVAALLHDIGHWPFCHPIEDIRLDGVPRHEEFAASFLLDGELGNCIEKDWGIKPRAVLALLSGEASNPAESVLSSMLSGPIDIDKLDYLMRDSFHAGVPYGRNYDQGRLIGSLCLNEAGDGLAITQKGKTAAEMMVFARYVMFSEVYWHHGVRAATAMLQRAFYLLYRDIARDEVFRLSQDGMVTQMRNVARQPEARELLDGLFGHRRVLYKRLAQFSFYESPEVYEQVARRSYDWLVGCSDELARALSSRTGGEIHGHEVLIDAPPVEKEVEFKIDVFDQKKNSYRPLEEVSPVVRTLAHEQFDDFVKRVRVFIHPRHSKSCSELGDLSQLLLEAAAGADSRAGNQVAQGS
jgi:HD superfamily phosphohydrolase